MKFKKWNLPFYYRGTPVVLAATMDENRTANIGPCKGDPVIYNFKHYHGLGPDLGKTFKATV